MFLPSSCNSRKKNTPISSESNKKKEKSSFLLITLDTWRWDYLGISGSGKVSTPNLDYLAKHGLYIKEVLTPCPLTTPAHATIFTGLNPLQHGVLDCTSYRLQPEFETLATQFKRKGYRTAAFVSSETLKRRFGLDQGFDVYDDSGIGKRDTNDWLPATKSGEDTTKAVLKYLTEEREAGPRFLWVHYYDLHVPYRARPEYDQRYPSQPYAAQASFLDDQVQLLMEIVNRDKDQSWKVMIVGDHGEGLGDHGEYGHGYGLYRSTLHVPLILFPNPELQAPSSTLCSLEDVFPTVLDWFDYEAKIEIDGSSLFRNDNEHAPFFSFSFLPAFMFRINPVLGIRKGPYMYIRHGLQELYNLDLDPDETKNLAENPEYREILSEMRRLAFQTYATDRLQPILQHQTLVNDQEATKSLQSLGYMSGGSVQLSSLQRVDIHQFLLDFNAMEAAQEAGFRSKDWTGLIRECRNMIHKYPQAQTVYKNFGKLLISQSLFKEAVPILEKAVSLNPEDSASMMNLGTLCIQMGDYPRARGLLTAALEIAPDDPQAHNNLAILCGDYLGDVPCAVEHFRRYLDLVPNAPERKQILSYIERNSVQR
ncbi:MAG TPA: sulfatase-like hydrolase/transferase [Thermoanaerobaculia bacterium]|nr:sulfatase-like hydrolase/transferase [Thermoanaerobaculia bacterium]HUM29657.1 sulfatase-like hydrolase/transferase [Thermoanaerobaculia bacterium]HXK67308.1 sulfatase-like hydrolase/transferase [Thermoanaerobaculia bacterium]